MIKTITENWLTGRELIKYLKILPSGLFDLLKAGLQAYSRDGIDKIINRDDLKARRKYSRDEIRRQFDLEWGDMDTQTVLAKPGVTHGPLEEKPIKEEKEQIVQTRTESQPLDTYDVPDGYIAISFTLSPGKKERKEQIEKAMSFQFKKTDIEKHPGLFPKANEETIDKKPVEEDKANEVPTDEPFIRNLKFCYESDYEIKIQESGKESISYNHKVLGFRSNKEKQWKTLLKILQQPNGTYHTNSEAERKILKPISEKLIINLFNKHYPVRIPKNFNLFERCPNESAGTYRPIFQIIEPDDIEVGKGSKYINLSNDQLLNEIEKLGEKQREIAEFDDEKQEKEILIEINTVVGIARGRNIPDNEILYYLKEDKEKIDYDPHENEPSTPKDY